MTSEKTDRIHSTVQQSFPHGRSRVVPVEKIPSTKEKPKESNRLILIGRKKNGRIVISVGPPANKKNARPKVGKPKRKNAGRRNRKAIGPSFLRSTPQHADRQSRIKGRRNSRAGSISSGGQSNRSREIPRKEPIRTARSTPAQRYLDQHERSRSRQLAPMGRNKD